MRHAADEVVVMQARAVGEGASATIVRIEVRRRSDELRDVIAGLIEAFADAQAVGVDTGVGEEIVGDLLRQDAAALKKEITAQKDRIRGLVDVVGSAAAAGDREQAEISLTIEVPIGDQLFGELVDNMLLRERFGFDVEQDRNALNAELELRAQLLEGIIRTIRDAVRVIEKMPAEPGGTRERELRRMKDLRNAFANSLRTTIRMLDNMGQQTAAHKQALISLTGELSDDILDPDVLMRVIGDWSDDLVDWVKSNAPALTIKVLMLVLIIAVARLFARLTQRLVRHGFQRSNVTISYLLRDFFIKTAGRTVMFLGILFGIAQLGVELGPLLAGLGIAGFIVGFALQDVLSNFASGLMILFYRPYDVGDTIEAANIRGKVDNMTLVSTMILTFDNQMLVVPNNKIWSDVIRNVTHQTQRRIDMEFGISYSDDVDHAERVFMDILSQHEKVLDDPEPMVKVNELGESSVNFAVRPWVRTDDYWTVYWDITREVKRRLDAEGIRIPFPQRDVHHYPAEGADSKS